MKNLIIGILATTVVFISVGAMSSSGTNLEREIYSEIANRYGKLALVADNNGDYLVVNIETAQAEYVEYDEPRPGRAVSAWTKWIK